MADDLAGLIDAIHRKTSAFRGGLCFALFTPPALRRLREDQCDGEGLLAFVEVPAVDVGGNDIVARVGGGFGVGVEVRGGGEEGWGPS